jgi:phosphatidylinositol phospholipase C delta
MFQRNVRCGYVLKPPPLRNPLKDEFRPENWRKKSHLLTVTIISAQQLPRVKVKDGSGHEVLGVDKDVSCEDGKGDKEKEKDGGGKNSVDPYVEVSLHVPEWTHCISPGLPPHASASASPLPQQEPELPLRFTTSKPKVHTSRTSGIKNNGFNPIWNHTLRIPFDCISQPGMMELIFVRFIVKHDSSGGSGNATATTTTANATTSSGSGAYKEDSAEPLALCCVSLGELQQGYRHLPLYDAMLSQYLFSTLFVKVVIS